MKFSITQNCPPSPLAFRPLARPLAYPTPVVYRCIPFKYRNTGENSDGAYEKVVEVLMISTPSGLGLVFPKDGWENDETVQEAAIREAVEEAGVQGDIMDCFGHYFFKSKTLQDELSPEGLCKAAMFPLLVKEELEFWPEQNNRRRSWHSIPKAIELCRHQWMKVAFEEGFSRWFAEQMISNQKKKNHLISPDSSTDQE